MRRIVPAVALTLLTAACGGGGDSTTIPTAGESPATSTPITIAPEATTTAPVTATTVAASTTTTTEPEPGLFEGTFQQVLGPGPNVWESVFVDPGGLVEHDGILYMFYNGIDSWPAEVHVGVATSRDGVHWDRQSDDWVFSGEGVGWIPVTMFVSSAVILDDGTWALYFYTISQIGVSTGSEIGMATAPGPEGPWTASDGPILTGGPEGAWDELSATHPSVVRVGDEWWMYYDGHRGDFSSEGDRAIGLARSADGLTWVKYDDPATTDLLYADSDPVMTTGAEGEWDASRVYDANVVNGEEGFVMTYFTHRPDPRAGRVDYVIGVASSEDGIDWVRHGQNPVLSSTRWGFQGIYLANMVRAFDSYLMMFDVQRSTGGGGTAVWLLEHPGFMFS